MNKPKTIVFFARSNNPIRGASTDLYGITGHPVLGDKRWIWTSKVVDIRDGGKTIETLNTIYKKLEG